MSTSVGGPPDRARPDFGRTRTSHRPVCPTPHTRSSYPGSMPPEDPAGPGSQPTPTSPPEVSTSWTTDPEIVAVDPAPTAPRRRPRAAVVILSAVLVLVLVGSALLLARMFDTTSAWEDSSAGWEKLANENAAELAATKSDLAAATAELEATNAQLATAQQR